MAVLVAHVGQTAAGLPQCPRFSREGRCHSDAHGEVTTRRLVPQVLVPHAVIPAKRWHEVLSYVTYMTREAILNALSCPARLRRLVPPARACREVSGSLTSWGRSEWITHF